MGCDIHIALERLIDNGTSWEAQCQWDEGDDYLRQADSPLRIDRSYDLFAVLANVRNYCLAEPISQPRGLPDDVSTMVRRWSEYDDDELHSHSWLSLAELRAYDWSQRPDGRGKKTTLRERCKDFLDSVEEACKEGDESEWRVVFFFDN